MIDEKQRKKFMQDAIKSYPWFVRLEMSMDEYFEEFNYFMYNVMYLHKGLKGYVSLYEQRKLDPSVVSNVPKQ